MFLVVNWLNKNCGRLIPNIQNVSRETILKKYSIVIKKENNFSIK